jgi:2-dehydro-3-deoxyphosphogluconate aldolase/(4S)-4-hydroxy-2-oxoglutarate aldolase
MMKMKPADILSFIRKTRLVPLFYHDNPDTSIKVLQAVFEGGLGIMEFTNRGPEAFGVFEKLYEYKSENHPENLLGIGSIVDAPSALRFINAGADFVVSPLLNQEVVKACTEKNILHIPGCSTLTEIYQAEVWGAQMIKVFPAEQLGGPKYIKAIKGPCPWLSIIVTGGVKATHENLLAWHNAGVEGFGIGSDLISKELVNQGNYTELTGKVKELVRIVREL